MAGSFAYKETSDGVEIFRDNRRIASADSLEDAQDWVADLLHNERIAVRSRWGIG